MRTPCTGGQKKCTIAKKSARMRFESNRIDNPGSNLATNTTNKRNIPLSRRPIMQEAPGAKTGPSWIRSSSLGVHLQLLDVPLARYQRVGLLVAGAEVLHGTTLDLTEAYVNTCRDRPGRFRTVVVAASRFDHYWKRTCAWTRRRWSSRWIINRLPGGTPERCHTDSPLRGFLPCSASRTGGPLCCGSVRIRTTERCGRALLKIPAKPTGTSSFLVLTRTNSKFRYWTLNGFPFHFQERITLISED
jgi:hypothetical protein